ncbi:MAG: 4-hydroxy-3-methylbut-2-enyl diphosphate reductase [Proteobacteria bacterium]|nr:4-hydroxy-3-methylbut-2-enyl diphosphate reductase [Pseudomonadota bacterium]
MVEDFTVFLASPRGFCAGVERAIETVKLCLRRYGKPVYVLHEIVHNKHVITELEESGAVFVENLGDVPKGEVCIFSAHGVSLTIERKARGLGLRTVDATCPLVTSVHGMVEKYHAMGYDVIIIGHHKHPEVEGTAGRVACRVHIVATEQEAEAVEVTDVRKVAFVTQTTLNSNDIIGIVTILKRRFLKIKGPKSNICFATQNRQDAVRQLAQKSDLLFVVGSKNSSNSNRLREVATLCGVEAYLVDDYQDIDPTWLFGKKRIGITAGASAPERLVDGVILWLQTHGTVRVVEMEGTKEKIHFKAAMLSC